MQFITSLFFYFQLLGESLYLYYKMYKSKQQDHRRSFAPNSTASFTSVKFFKSLALFMRAARYPSGSFLTNQGAHDSKQSNKFGKKT